MHIVMEAQTYWNEVGSKKEFEDPLYLDKLRPFLHPHSSIVEYGCGYGRLLNALKSEGYENLLGFDFAPKMIERGKAAFPHLNLELLTRSGSVPLEKNSCDVVLLSTVLCCMIEKPEQKQLIAELERILREEGVLYLSDFLISDHPRYADKYRIGYETYEEWGIYTTSEGIAVRHHTTAWIFDLLKNFDVHWFEQFDFQTMNHHPARTFHAIARI